MRNRIIELDDGDVIVLASQRTFHLTCCDCNLTHRVDVLRLDNECHLKLTRDGRRTAQKRRRARESQTRFEVKK